MPRGGGALRRIDVRLRDNCVVGIPSHPTSCSVATTNVADRATAATQKAFAKIADELGMAEVGAINAPAKGVISGIDERSGKAYINQLFLGNTGGPGTRNGDGWLTYSHVGNGAMAFVESIEMAELHHPIVIERRMLVPDSEGAGKYIGAQSLQIEFGPVGSPMTVVYASDGNVNAAEGIQGGGCGGPARQSIVRTGGEVEDLPSAAKILIVPGERVVSVSTGGGGFGDPKARDRTSVEKAVQDGLLTLERALSVYGVDLRASGDL